jgi:hypothetical protein
MITLYQFPPAFGLPNASPFCLKLELYLRMAGLPYRNSYTLELHKAPKGKLPWIDDDGTAVADSGLIIDYLKHGSTAIRSMPGWMRRQRCTRLAIARLIEEHLYWTVLYDRWIAPQGWAMTRAGFFGTLPWPLRMIVPWWPDAVFALNCTDMAWAATHPNRFTRWALPTSTPWRSCLDARIISLAPAPHR